MVDIKKETVKSVKWSAIGQYSNTLISFVVGIVLARLLDPLDFGILGMVAIFFSIAIIITDCGFGQALIRKKNATEADFCTTFYYNLGVSSFFYIVLFFTSPYIANFLYTPELKDLVRISALTLPIGALGTIQFLILKKNLDFRKPAKITVVSNILSGIVGVVMAYKGEGVWSLVGMSVSKCVFDVIFVWLVSTWRPQLIFSVQSFKESFSFGSKVLLTTILSRTFTDIQNLLIAKFYTPRSLGFYTKGHSTAQLPVNIFFGVLSSVTFPIMSKIQDDDERLIHVYRRYIRMSSLLIFFFMSLLAALAHPIMIFLYSAKWEPAVIFLQLFCFCSMFGPIGTINISLMLVKGRSDLNLKCEIIRKIIWLIALLVALPISVTALCISSIVAAQGSLIVNTYYTGKYFNVGYFEQWKDFGGYLLLSIFSCVPAFLIATNLQNPLISIPLGALSSMFFYFGILLYRKDENLIDVISLLLNNALFDKIRFYVRNRGFV